MTATRLPSRLPARVNGVSTKTLEAGVTACWQIALQLSRVRAREAEFKEAEIEFKETEAEFKKAEAEFKKAETEPEEAESKKA